MSALACPASLKGVLSATEAAAALAAGLRGAGAEAVELPVADGGEGTAAVLAAALGGEWRTARGAPTRSAGRSTARWLADCRTGRRSSSRRRRSGSGGSRAGELDPLAASSAGLGDCSSPRSPTGRRRCSSASAARRRSTAARACSRSCRRGRRGSAAASRATSGTRCSASAARRGSSGRRRARRPEAVEELERRLAGMAQLAPYRDLPGAGAAGGLGAALASLGGELVEGAELVLDLVGFDERARGADARRHRRGHGRRARRSRARRRARSSRAAARLGVPLRALRRASNKLSLAGRGARAERTVRRGRGRISSRSALSSRLPDRDPSAGRRRSCPSSGSSSVTRELPAAGRERRAS